MSNRRRSLIGAGLAAAIAFTAVTSASLLLPPSSGQAEVTIEFDGICLNPPLWFDDDGWMTGGRFPSGPAESVSGTFIYDGDTGTFVSDELEMPYTRVEGFLPLDCSID